MSGKGAGNHISANILNHHSEAAEVDSRSLNSIATEARELFEKPLPSRSPESPKQQQERLETFITLSLTHLREAVTTPDSVEIMSPFLSFDYGLILSELLIRAELIGLISVAQWNHSHNSYLKKN